jgi:cyanate lyase
MSLHRLDVPELHRRLDAQRQDLGLSWRGVGRQVGLPVSVFTRIGKGRAIEADALITLIAWLDLDNEIAILVQPGQQPIPCGICGRNFQPKRDGTVRTHTCEDTA